jgi:hypothetical protein
MDSSPPTGDRCLRCGGPHHPATGHIDARTGAIFCGACYRPFLDWLKGHLKRRWGKLRFYEHTETSRRVP